MKFIVTGIVLLALSGCGMIPVAGLLVDNRHVKIFIVNSTGCEEISHSLAASVVQIVDQPEQADYLILLSRPITSALKVQLINRSGGLMAVCTYFAVAGNDRQVVAMISRDIVRNFDQPPPAVQQFRWQQKHNHKVQARITI